ncbi:MAG: NitT/TauT family transport system substrate-binding protein [Candidatus Eremiobacteraeota bacterium]|nr:NitT/TauT family transport system substrate-binding protein [Candidatus Eremiobacteraeota bacterium]
MSAVRNANAVTRAGVLRALGAAGAALAVPAVARAAGKNVTVRIGTIASDVSAEPLYADAQGIFGRGGLDAQISALANGGAIIAAVASGALDAGFANLTSIAAARQRGVPVRILAPATMYTDKAAVTVLVRARGSKLRTGGDLRDKTIAVSTLKGELQVGASAWIDKNGGDASRTHFIEMPFSAMAAALAAGRVDAAMLTEPALTIHKDAVELLARAYTAIADEFLIGAFVASESWLRDNADAAKRFTAAMAETARWANAHHAETAVILAKRASLDEALVRSMTRATYGERLDAEHVQPVLDAAVKYGSLKSAMKASELIG